MKLRNPGQHDLLIPENRRFGAARSIAGYLGHGYHDLASAPNSPVMIGFCGRTQCMSAAASGAQTLMRC